MAALPYTDGSDGNGITKAPELLAYLSASPQSFFDVPFMDSYLSLLAKHSDTALSIYDDKTASPELHAELAQWLCSISDRTPAPAFILIRRRLLRVSLEIKKPIASRNTDPVEWAAQEVLFQAEAAARAGHAYALCASCDAMEACGYAADAGCQRMTMTVKGGKPSDGSRICFREGHVHHICCGEAQIIRDADPFTSASRTAKLAAWKAWKVDGQPLGKECKVCELPSCNAREVYRKAFKRCGRCGLASYCCPVHAKQDWKRHKASPTCVKRPAAEDD